MHRLGNKFMRNLITILILLICFSVKAANPSFSSFNANQFNTTGNTVNIKSGALLTNINGSTITNLAIKTLSRDFGVTGSGDETAKIQSALNAASPVLVDVSFTAGNLFITNSSCLIGDGHSIANFNTGSTGDFFSSVSGVTNFTFTGLIIEGQKTGFNAGSGTRPWSFSASYAVSQNVTVQRNGIHFGSANTNSILKNCIVRNFSGDAYMIDGYGVTFPQPVANTVKIVNCSAETSWEGFCTTNSAEYVVIDNCSAQVCGRAIAKKSGNNTVLGGDFTRNALGIYVAGSGFDNPAHSLNVGCSFNHCEVGAVCTDFSNGEFFTGCTFIGGGPLGGNTDIFLTNTAGVTFNGCFFNNSCIVSNVNSTNFLINPIAQGYPTVSISGVLYQTGWQIINAATPLTNNFTNFFTAPQNINTANIGTEIVTNTVTSYNGTATAGNGLAPIVASISLTGQNASIASTALYTNTSGLTEVLRVSGNVMITTAGPSTGALTVGITWTNNLGAASANLLNANGTANATTKIEYGLPDIFNLAVSGDQMYPSISLTNNGILKYSTTRVGGTGNVMVHTLDLFVEKLNKH